MPIDAQKIIIDTFKSQLWHKNIVNFLNSQSLASAHFMITPRFSFSLVSFLFIFPNTGLYIQATLEMQHSTEVRTH